MPPTASSGFDHAHHTSAQDHILSRHAPRLCRQWLLSHLLLPPEPRVAASLHAACRTLASGTESLPALPVTLPASKITQCLELQAGGAPRDQRKSHYRLHYRLITVGGVERTRCIPLYA